MNLTQDEIELISEFISSNFKTLTDIASKNIKKIDDHIKLHIKSTYTNYLKNTYSRYSKTKSFFIRSLPVHLYEYYIPIGIECDSYKIQNPGIKSCTDFSHRLIITGSAGCGKSMFIRHLFLDAIKDKKYVPILVELRDLNDNVATINDAIQKNMQSHDFDMSIEYIEMAKKCGHFCFLLDGYDEVNHEKEKHVLAEIKSISNRYNKCPIIISTRNIDSIVSIDNFYIFSMKNLEIDDAINLINKLPYDDIVKNNFINDLKEGIFNKHHSFLSNPLLLSIMLLTYGENSEIPSKLSLFYNYAYEALFQRHDAYKGGYSRCRRSELDILDYTKVFELFSLRTYDKRLFKMPRRDCLEHIEKSKKTLSFNFGSEQFLDDCLNAVCLLIEDGLDISFTHRSFQEYFVATYISSSEEKIQEMLISKYMTYMLSDTVFNILFEISPRTVEKFAILPCLEKMFTVIDVEHSITYDNYIKYIEMFYYELIFCGGLRSVSFSPSHDNITNILFKLPLYYKKFDTSRTSAPSDRCKYITGDIEGQYKFTFKTNDYNFNTLDIISEEFYIMSFSFLKLVYDLYIETKNKHLNSVRSIEELLL